ncbi:hypothetical protein KR009_008304, partial [Drosophila setifemur]
FRIAANFTSFFGVTMIGLFLGIVYRFFVGLWKFIRLSLARICKAYSEYTPVIYLSNDMLTFVSKRRLQLVAKKTLVLDMDETLMTSVLRKFGGPNKPLPNVPYDFAFCLPEYDCNVYVYKRPYVDRFLDHMSRWYNLVIFTASAEAYASPILDYLDNGRGILNNRMYRHHCINVHGELAKYVSLASPDLANVLLLDNSNVECSFNAGNSINISSFGIGQRDEALICLLPFLDGLRFTKDVRSVLRLCTRFEDFTA